MKNRKCRNQLRIFRYVTNFIILGSTILDGHSHLFTFTEADSPKNDKQNLQSLRNLAIQLQFVNKNIIVMSVIRFSQQIELIEQWNIGKTKWFGKSRFGWFNRSFFFFFFYNQNVVIATNLVFRCNSNSYYSSKLLAQETHFIRLSWYINYSILICESGQNIELQFCVTLHQLYINIYWSQHRSSYIYVSIEVNNSQNVQLFSLFSILNNSRRKTFRLRYSIYMLSYHDAL